jgi:hypothetical protein
VTLVIVPMTLDEANVFVEQHHRTHRPVVSHKFSLGVATTDGAIVGVVIVGRPVARHLDDGWTLEVTRCCTDGTKNAASCLYAAAWRATRALGYRRCVTYTAQTEPGTSLTAAGWRVVGEVAGQLWSRPSRPRVDLAPAQAKWRWEASSA